MNLDLISASVTAPGAAGLAAVAVTGDSLTIRNSARSGLITAVAMWSYAQAAGFTQVTYPSGHDLVRGIRFRNLALTPVSKLPLTYAPRFRPQDPVSILHAGSAVAGDVETVHMQIFYENVPGISGRLINLAALRSRGMNLLTVEDTSTGTAANAYTGQRTLNQAADLFRADTDYALIGACIGAATGVLSVRGVDSGGMRCAIPGTTDVDITAEWFTRLSEGHDYPMIPVFNSANRAAIFIDQCTNENFGAVPFSLTFAELSPAGPA